MTDLANVAAAIRAFNEGVQAMQEGDSDRAAARWSRAAKLDPGMVPAHHNLVVYHEQRGQTREVIASYDAILAFDPFDTQALIRQASAFRRAGDVGRAIQNYERAIAVYPYFRFWYDELATLYDQIGDTESSSIWRDRALTLDTDEAEMAFEDGVRQQREKNYELAVAIFEAVLEEQPANLDARLRLAESLRILGRPDEALVHLDQAFELTDAAPALALFHRGRLKTQMGQPQSASADLRAALDSVPSYGRASRLLGRIEGEPSGTSSWSDTLGAVIQQAVARPSRSGKPGRVAFLVEAHVALAPIIARVMDMVARPDAQLFGSGISRAFFVEGEPASGTTEHGTLAEGWYGSSYFEPALAQWTDTDAGLPIDRMLESAQLAVGADGFNLLVFIGAGNVRSDQENTAKYLAAVPTYDTVVLTPTGAPSALSDAVRAHASNLIELVASA